MHNEIKNEAQLPTYSKRQRSCTYMYISNAGLNSFRSSNIYGKAKLFVKIPTLTTIYDQ